MGKETTAVMSERLDGLLVLDKPGGITSREAVDRALRWFPRGTKIGHTGTLDPLATGVLVLCLGGATRFAEYVQRMSKTYRSTFRLGARSDTDDAQGTVRPGSVTAPPDEGAVRAALTRFVGLLAQVPPAYSAAHVSGRRAHELARKGQEVRLEARPVRVYGIAVLAYAYPVLEVEVHCGKGTYIRSLARDLGEALGCGGYVQVLRRTRVGPFSADDAVPLSATAAEALARLEPAQRALEELPRVTLAEGDARRLAHGQRLRIGQPLSAPADADAAGFEVAVHDPTGRLVAIACCDPRERLLRPLKVIGQPDR
jgi:tRNA pseudouridine55 synthase